MSEFIAEAQVLITPNVTGFATALRLELEAAVAKAGPVAVPVVAASNAASVAAVSAAAATSAGAFQALSVAQKDAAASALGLAAPEKVVNSQIGRQAVLLDANVIAMEADAAATERNTITKKINADAAHRQVLAQSQATRALFAQGAAAAGLRGTALTASAVFLGTTVAVLAFGKAIKAASDETEELNKSAVVFGQSSEEIRKFAETSANSLGISATEALRATGIFGNLFRTIQISQPVSAAMSERLVQLASDLSSFNNADPSRTLEALRSGLVGQARPLRVFGIFLSQARAQEEALIETGKKSTQALTQRDLVQARYNLILKDGAIANHDFANTSDRLANQSRILAANTENLSAQLGQTLVPTLTLVVRGMNDLLGGTQKAIVGLRGLRDSIEHSHAFEGFNRDVESATGGVSDFFLHVRDGIPFLNRARSAVQGLAGGEKEAAGPTKSLAGYLDAGARAARGAAFAIVAANKAVKDIGQTISGLQVQQLRIQTGLASGGRSAEESNLQQQVAADKKAVAAAKSGTKARRDALLQLKDAQDQLAALQDQDAQDAKDRAQKQQDAAATAKQAAQDAARAQEDATNAFIERHGHAGLDAQLAIATANNNVKAEVRINQAIVASDKAEIVALRERIKHLHLHGAALKAAQAAIAAANQEIKLTLIQIQQDQADQRQAQLDAINQRLDLRIQIADAGGNLKQQIAARRAKLAEITKELVRAKKEFGKNSLAWLELKAAQAEQIKAIKDLQNQNKTAGKDSRKEAAAFFFSQLQAQQGFASNLLGNLITGSTAGLVGNPSPAAAAGQAQTKEKAQTPTSPTRGQHQTTNDILLRILHALTRSNRNDQAPEARHNRHVGAAIMDNDGIHGI